MHRILTLFLCTVAVQAQFPVRYLGEIGRLSNLDLPDIVNLGIAKVRGERDLDLQVFGTDAIGRPWKMWLEATGLAAGGTHAWSGDFDGNGNRDLLIALRYFGNGRCIDSTVIYTLMFDKAGRPMPQVWETHRGFVRLPFLLEDRNHNGRGELVTTECEPSVQFPREERRVTGVFEAENMKWAATPNADSYLSSAKRQLGRDGSNVHWQKTRSPVATSSPSQDGTVSPNQIRATKWSGVVIETPAELRIYFTGQERGIQEITRKHLSARAIASSAGGAPVLWATQ